MTLNPIVSACLFSVLIVAGCGSAQNNAKIDTVLISKAPSTKETDVSLTKVDVANALSLDVKYVVDVAKNWALVSRPVEETKRSPSQEDKLIALEEQLVAQCGEEDRSCAIEVVGQEKVCEIWGCNRFELVEFGATTTAMPIGKPHGWIAQKKGRIVLADIDHDGRLEASVSIGWHYEIENDVVAVYVVDTETRVVQGAYVQRHESVIPASEGMDDWYDVEVQNPVYSETKSDLVFRRVSAGGSFCYEQDADGFPAPMEPDFEGAAPGCEVETSQKTCQYFADADLYRCDGEPMVIPTKLEL